MKRIVGTMAIALVIIIWASSVTADLTPEQTKNAQALIDQFKNPEFAVRQKAVEQLIAMGPDVLPLIRKTLGETNDQEVKLRCQMVIDGLVAKHGPEILVQRRPVVIKGKVVDAGTQSAR